MDDTEIPRTLSWWAFLIIVVCAGMLGGLIAAVLKSLKHITENMPDYDDAASLRAHNEMCRRMKLKRFFCGRAVVGIGGGFAAILGGTWVGKISYMADTENIVSLASLCVVAGTIAHNLVPGIGEKLSDELLRNQVKNIGVTTDKKTAKIAEQTAEYKAYALKISHADTALSTRTLSDINQAIRGMEDLAELYPTDRTVYIYLGRLFRAKKQYDRAIKVLRTFLVNIDKNSDKLSNPDIEDAKSVALYNIACYHALKFKELHLESEDRLKQEAASLLRESIGFDKENLIVAKEDPDFDGVLTAEEIEEMS